MNKASNIEQIMASFADCGEAERIEAFIIDVNGVARGKWLPFSKAEQIARNGLPMPRSLYAQDIWGQDVDAAGLAMGTGDPDGACFPVPHTIRPVPWAETPTAQVITSMCGPDGAPFFADPRAILQQQIDGLKAMGMTANVAVELEFYLVTDAPGLPRPVRFAQPGDGDAPFPAGNVLAIEMLQEQEGFFNEVLKACRALGLPEEGVLHENSPGQFEINLSYRSDPLLAADEAIMFKRAVKAVARRHGMRATFMAKPFGHLAGSGMHVHVSLLDNGGRPLFADSRGDPSPNLLHAVGGLMRSLPDTMLLAAPHANSYRRFRANAHVPTQGTWGWGDRSAALRVISGDPRAMRIEHRLAGADANPYLMVAGVLAGVIEGIQQRIEPGAPQDPAAPAGQALPLDWRQAIACFESSEFVGRHFGEPVRQMISACKWQDYEGLLSRIPEIEYETYLASA